MLYYVAQDGVSPTSDKATGIVKYKDLSSLAVQLFRESRNGPLNKDDIVRVVDSTIGYGFKDIEQGESVDAALESDPKIQEFVDLYLDDMLRFSKDNVDLSLEMHREEQRDGLGKEGIKSGIRSPNSYSNLFYSRCW